MEETAETADSAQPTTGAGYPKLTDEQIAEKRAKIVGRHSKWEAELNDLIEKQEVVVNTGLPYDTVLERIKKTGKEVRPAPFRRCAIQRWVLSVFVGRNRRSDLGRPLNDREI